MKAEKVRALYKKRDDHFWEWREAVEKIGIDATLDILGFSKDRNTLWYNEHTGSVQTLDGLIIGESLLGGRNETEEEQTFEFAMVCEHWLPQNAIPNPVIARSMKLTEYSAMMQVARHLQSHADRNKTADAFMADVHSQGGSLEDGGYSVSKPGKVSVDLHDGREFVFSLRSIWNELKKTDKQLTLFAV